NINNNNRPVPLTINNNTNNNNDIYNSNIHIHSHQTNIDPKNPLSQSLHNEISAIPNNPPKAILSRQRSSSIPAHASPTRTSRAYSEQKNNAHNIEFSLEQLWKFIDEDPTPVAFCGDITREEAENALSAMPKGTFLLRWS